MTDQQSFVTAEQWADVADKLMRKYGRNGSGRASALRLVGVYFLYRQGGYAALKKYGFSRNSIQLYLEKLTDAGVLSA
jgi:hypothetical protein